MVDFIWVNVSYYSKESVLQTALSLAAVAIMAATKTTTKGTGTFVVVLADVAARLAALSQSVTSAVVFAE